MFKTWQGKVCWVVQHTRHFGDALGKWFVAGSPVKNLGSQEEMPKCFHPQMQQQPILTNDITTNGEVSKPISLGTGIPGVGKVNTFAVGVRIYLTLSSHINRYFHTILKLHYSRVDCVRELFKPSKHAERFLVSNEKNLGFGFFVGDIISGVSFWPFWLRLPGYGPQPQDGIF